MDFIKVLIKLPTCWAKTFSRVPKSYSSEANVSCHYTDYGQQDNIGVWYIWKPWLLWIRTLGPVRRFKFKCYSEASQSFFVGPQALIKRSHCFLALHWWQIYAIYIFKKPGFYEVLLGDQQEIIYQKFKAQWSKTCLLDPKFCSTEAIVSMHHTNYS